MVCRIKANREHQWRRFCFDVVATIGARTSPGDPRLASFLGCVDSGRGAALSKNVDDKLLKLVRGPVSTPKLRDLLISWETQLREEVQKVVNKAPRSTPMPHNSAVTEDQLWMVRAFWMNEIPETPNILKKLPVLELFRATPVSDGMIYTAASFTRGEAKLELMEKLNRLFGRLCQGMSFGDLGENWTPLADENFKSHALKIRGQECDVRINAECLSNFPEYTRMLLITTAFLAKIIGPDGSDLEEVWVDQKSGSGEMEMKWTIRGTKTRKPTLLNTTVPASRQYGNTSTYEWYQKLRESFPRLQEESLGYKWDVLCLKADLLRYRWHHDEWLTKSSCQRSKLFGRKSKPFSDKVGENLRVWSYEAETKYLSSYLNKTGTKHLSSHLSNIEKLAQEQFLKWQFRLRTLGYAIVDLEAVTERGTVFKCLNRDKEGYKAIMITVLDSGLVLLDRSSTTLVDEDTIHGMSRNALIPVNRMSGWKDILCEDGRFARYSKSLAEGPYSDTLSFLLQFLCKNFENFDYIRADTDKWGHIWLKFQGNPSMPEIRLPARLPVDNSNTLGDTDQRTILNEWKIAIEKLWHRGLAIESSASWDDWERRFDQEWTKRFQMSNSHSNQNQEDTTYSATTD